MWSWLPNQIWIPESDLIKLNQAWLSVPVRLIKFDLWSYLIGKSPLIHTNLISGLIKCFFLDVKARIFIALFKFYFGCMVVYKLLVELWIHKRNHVSCRNAANSYVFSNVFTFTFCKKIKANHKPYFLWVKTNVSENHSVLTEEPLHQFTLAVNFLEKLLLFPRLFFKIILREGMTLYLSPLTSTYSLRTFHILSLNFPFQNLVRLQLVKNELFTLKIQL